MPTIAPNSSRLPTILPENRDSLGFGRLSEGQLKAVIELIKHRHLLNEPAPEDPQGRGIVISAGGKYAEWGLVNCKWIRHQGVQLPIQVWHLGPKEIPSWMPKHFADLDVELVDAFKVREKHWHRGLKGWTVKQYSAMRAPWREVLSVDADCFITKDPAHVLNDPEFQSTGAFFCADVNRCRASNWVYFYAGIRTPDQEMESGYFAWDRVKAWEGIKFTDWVGQHSDVFDKLIYGDKSRPEIGFGTTKTPFLFANTPTWIGSGIRHFWKGEAICDHLMAWKREESTCPHKLLPSLFEEVRSLRR